MATAEEYAQWIVDNQDQQGSDEFNTVAQAYEMAKQQSMTKSTGSVMNPVNPTYIPGPTGAGALMEDLRGAQVFKPLTENVTNRIGQYIAKPAKAVVDAATVLSTGMPIAPAAMYDTYKAVQESIPKMRQALGSVGDISPEAVATFADKLKSKDFAAFQDLVKTQGGKAAVQTYQLPAYLANDAEAQAAFNAMKTQAQAAPGMISRVAGPILNTAAKVAGPVMAGVEGYEGLKQARQGDRTGAALSGLGAASMLNPIGLLAQPGISMMQSANQNFRQQTPQQQQESSMDALSGTAPGMAGEAAAFAGNNMQDRINMAIRLRAAKKVLGPVAPTGQ